MRSMDVVLNLEEGSLEPLAMLVVVVQMEI